MVRSNVKNGTAVGNDHLCRRCTWGQCMTGYRESYVLMICTNTNPNLKVPFAVMDCTEFSDKHRPSFLQMTKLAIHVARTRISAPTAGFAAGTKVQPIRRANEDEGEDADEVARVR
jgi:hypothetical protein